MEINHIPVYRMEEHHEAFYIWNKAIEDGVIPSFGLTLLHVDHHPDFEMGAYRGGLEPIFGTIEEKKRFTYETLGIADFIAPAIYEGIFNEYVYVHQFYPMLSKKEERVLIFTSQGFLQSLQVSALIRPAVLKENANHRFFFYQEGGIGHFSPKQPVVLDIDLDYFCWDDSLSTGEEKIIEITKEAYEDFLSNPLHPYRILPRALVTVVQREGHYYLKCAEVFKPDPIPSGETIDKRIVRFGEWLKNENIHPALIDICRSCHSGYTPVPVWKQIEERLFEVLREVL